jgi:maltooligosyltrehalose trehalohydrolase
MIDLSEVGAFSTVDETGSRRTRFGVYLPQIRSSDGYEVIVRIIHKSDRFDPLILPRDFPLAWQEGHSLDLWTVTARLDPVPKTNFGSPGTYLYRYQLLHRNSGGGTDVITNWFTDPFARAADIGELSAFTTPDATADFQWEDANFKVPAIDDLVVYELNAEEFNGSFFGLIDRLTYLQSLGVNTLELMPVTSLKLDFDWGYGPIHYFAPNERLGGVRGFKELVNACHKLGFVMIMDVVFQHVDRAFPYKLVYADASKPSPMIGNDGPFGPQVDYSLPFAQEYFAATTAYWMEMYHVDGFRYDEVDDFYFGPTDTAYAKLVFETYNRSLGVSRFQGPGGCSRIIQCAEAIGKKREVLAQTYTNSAWQDELLNKAQDMAKFRYSDDAFAHLLDPRFMGYPDSKTVKDAHGNDAQMPVAPFQYLESHDHSSLISFVGTTQDDPNDVPFGDRSQFYKLQPFVIALYTCQGVPMLWEGQEFADNWTLPPGGRRRISFRRDIHWEYFYDFPGNALIRLYRILGSLRREHPALRSRKSYYFYQQSRPQDGILAYMRQASAAGQISQEVAMVFLNFSDSARQISVPFPSAATYRELIDDQVRRDAGSPTYEVNVSSSNENHAVTVPSNYGFVFISA